MLRAKINKEELQKLLEKGEMKYTELANHFGISCATLSYYRNLYGLGRKHGILTNKSKRLIQIHPQTLQILAIHRSADTASEMLNICRSDISGCAIGTFVQAGGYYWRYYDNYIKTTIMMGERQTFINQHIVGDCRDLDNLPNHFLINDPFTPSCYIQPLIANVNGCIITEEWRTTELMKNDYMFSNFGRVKTVKQFPYERLLSQTINQFGYNDISLNLNGIEKRYRVHRLIAEAFIPNPNNLPQVNHKDENKINNCIWNLEWCTAQYNMNYGTRNERISKSWKTLDTDK